MNWALRYAITNKEEFNQAMGNQLPYNKAIDNQSRSMGPDTFYAGDGILKVGPKTYPMDPRGIKNGFGAMVSFPNGHHVNVSWEAESHSDNRNVIPYRRDTNDLTNKHPKRVEAIHWAPDDREIRDWPIHESINGPIEGNFAMARYLDHNQVNALMEHVKGLQ